jgi:hypothetical protein
MPASRPNFRKWSKFGHSKRTRVAATFLSSWINGNMIAAKDMLTLSEKLRAGQEGREADIDHRLVGPSDHQFWSSLIPSQGVPEQIVKSRDEKSTVLLNTLSSISIYADPELYSCDPSGWLVESFRFGFDESDRVKSIVRVQI